MGCEGATVVFISAKSAIEMHARGCWCTITCRKMETAGSKRPGCSCNEYKSDYFDSVILIVLEKPNPLSRPVIETVAT